MYKKIGLLVLLFVLIITVATISKAVLGPKDASIAATAEMATTTSGSIIKTCLAPNASNPILKNSSLFTGAEWNDPSVIKVGNQFVMYASADTNFSQNIKIYRLTSNDGSKWSLASSTPVLEKSTDPNAWDSKSVETPSVVYFKNTYYLFYLGYHTSFSDPYDYKIGYATSKDGIHWSRANTPIVVPTSPHSDPTLDFKQFIVGEPGAVVFNNSIYLYFTAIGADASVKTTLQTIGLITSTDGVQWSSPKQVLKPDQTQYPRAKGWLGYSTPAAVVIKGKLHLFFDVINEKPSWTQQKIAHAVSTDGITAWAQDTTSLFDRSDFAWTKTETRAPAPYYDGSTLKLWIAGTWPGNNLGIGLLTCNL
jgi:sucrose-6-phosphate hydrolase SacC (GH32 family)